jgi:N-carbamoylputrescine amidase
MAKLKIALLQLTSLGMDQRANLLKGEEYCRRATQLGADIALFPEMWNVGYQRYDPDRKGAREQWIASAIPRDGEFVGRYRALASELEMAIAVTYLEAWEPLPRNSVSLIDRTGEIVLTYAKVHTCAFDAPEVSCTPGDAFHVCELDTGAGRVKVGLMICFDREFPESARVLMLKGAEIILTPNACALDDAQSGIGDVRIDQFRSRAFENLVGVAMANYASPQYDGRSVAFDGDGALLLQAGEEEGVQVVEFDLAKLRAWRRQEAVRNQQRKPRSYRLIASTESALD